MHFNYKRWFHVKPFLMLFILFFIFAIILLTGVGSSQIDPFSYHTYYPGDFDSEENIKYDVKHGFSDEKGNTLFINVRNPVTDHDMKTNERIVKDVGKVWIIGSDQKHTKMIFDPPNMVLNPETNQFEEKNPGFVSIIKKNRRPGKKHEFHAKREIGPNREVDMSQTIPDKVFKRIIQDPVFRSI